MSSVDKEKIDKLIELLQVAQTAFKAAAQYAGENNIPLTMLDEDSGFNSYEEGTIDFSGVQFELQEQWNNKGQYEWYNSNCY